MKLDTKKDIINIICLVVIMLLGLILLHDICDSSLIGRSYWDSYELQAEAWLKGKISLDENYYRLELAEYKGKYYVSFPPFPSVVMLPCVIFGIPNNLIIALACMATVIIAYRMLRRQGTNEYMSMFISLFYVFGSNVTAMSLNGGVWWMAQVFNMLLCTLAVNFALNDKRMLSYICLGLAVGCRPFSAIYIVALFIIYLIKDGFKPKELFSRHILPALPLILIAGCYMAYNYARFENVLEFGHNYLPEFLESEKGQFSLSYLLPNLKRLTLGLIKVDSYLNLHFTKYNGFMFFIANPLFLIGIVYGIKNIIKKQISRERIVLTVAIIINLLLLCCHKTLGGWQFGARYTCDMLPFVLMCLMISVGEKRSANGEMIKVTGPLAPVVFNKFDIAVAVFGIMFNAFGAVEFWLRLI